MKQLRCPDLHGGDIAFNANDAFNSPSNLASLLQRNLYFSEAGFLMPNQR